jgi:hypothetical protein
VTIEGSRIDLRRYAWPTTKNKSAVRKRAKKR